LIKSRIELDENDPLYITYTAHPWRGGYSAVNFYAYLQNLVPKDRRPRVASIRYESPGWLELTFVVLAVVLSLRRIIKAFCDSGKEITSLYNDIYKGLQERRLLSLSVKREELHLQREQLEFVEYSMDSLAKMLGFTGLAELRKIAPSPLAALKILLSFYRRVRTLAEYQQNGKADFRSDDVSPESSVDT
jgi:hypothetical protein